MRQRALVACSLAVVFCGFAIPAGRAQAPAPADPPTFSKDIAPILHAQCVSCHRPGEVAPMPLRTYAEARPWAASIARQVAAGTMPPWHAEAPRGTFANERRLTDAEKTVIERWVAAGAPQGDPAGMPAPPAFVEGWRLGEPDAVLQMPEAYAVPAEGTVAYEYFYIPSGLAESRWLEAIEVRPGNRALVHHVLVYYAAPGETGPRAAPALMPTLAHSRVPRSSPGSRPRQRLPGGRQLVATYAPGTDPQVLPAGTAMELAPGGVFELQMHYTANGTAGTDRTSLGLHFAAAAPATEVVAAEFINAVFTIPPGASNHQVTTEAEFLQAATVWGLFPHTHVRGTRWEYTLQLPDGSSRPLLSVPRYDFNWQTYYMFREPVAVPRGARIVSSAWYDNSAANRSNPDPTATVRWGDQTWEEMQYTGVLYSVR